MDRASWDFENLIVDALERGEVERYVLPADAEARLRRIFVQAPMSHGALQDVLRLIVALETRLDSPTAAERVRTLVRTSPDATALLARRRLGKGIDQVRAHKTREGRRLDTQAPVHGARARAGSVPLRSLLDPISQDATQARAARAARR